jgi:hypothetical protein
MLHIFSLGKVKIDPRIHSAAHQYIRPQSTGEKTYGEMDEYLNERKF